MKKKGKRESTLSKGKRESTLSKRDLAKLTKIPADVIDLYAIGDYDSLLRPIIDPNFGLLNSISASVELES